MKKSKLLKEGLYHIFDNSTMIFAVSFILLILRVAVYFLAGSEIKWAKTFVEPMLQYKECFDFCSVLLLIITVCAWIEVKDSRRRHCSVLINFVNTIVCWSYIPDIFGWIKKWVSSFLLNIVKWFSSTQKHILYFLIIVLLIAIIYVGVKWKNKIAESLKRVKNHMKKYPVYWLIFSVHSIFFVLRGSEVIGYLFDFKVLKIQKVINQLQSVLILFSICSMTYLCIHIRKGIKKIELLPHTLTFFDLCVCTLGIFSIRSYVNKLISYLTSKKFSSQNGF